MFKSFVRALSSDFETHTTAASAEAAAEVCAIVSEASGSEVSVSRDSSCNTSADFPRSPSSRNPMARKRESLQVAKSIYTCYIFFGTNSRFSLKRVSASDCIFRCCNVRSECIIRQVVQVERQVFVFTSSRTHSPLAAQYLWLLRVLCCFI